MIPRIAATTPTQSRYLAFIEALGAAGFEGELCPDYASRTVLATDNSIYQILPQGVLYPRDTADLVRIARLAGEERFADIVLAPRGGGTGTNGQSLGDGIVVDVSRHMNRILDIDVDARRVRVQAGVVKDQLNAALAPHGLFFAPELSTSNRATLGGMINTDASGQGSCLYGKTRDHVLGLESVLLDGTVWDSAPVDAAELERIRTRSDRVGEIHRVVADTVDTHAELIEARFPRLNRCLTGYDLAHVRTPDGRFDLNAILCGAEGTLAFIAEATLNVVPIPRCSALVNVRYGSFDETLRDAQVLMQAGPSSIETVDSKVLALAMNDIVWDTVREFFPDDGGVRGVNLVEYTAEDEAQLRRRVRGLTERLEATRGQPGHARGYTVAYGEAQVRRIWGMRKKAVGLLGNAEGERRPVPFVEDTAVPPENLADFIAEFRALLDRHGLEYGMFGHVDAGVLHVRPALDLKDPGEEHRVREISDAVVALTRKYRGLLWGEHGKGVRSEYAPEFFGPLYPCLQRIKAAFDPRNQINPGKICTPPGVGALHRIDAVPTRGQHDRTIPEAVRAGYAPAMHCNGNGACFNYDPADAMCPSWKATRERIHSPKGRAALTREWLRLLAERGVDPLAEAETARRSGAFLRALLPRLASTLGRRRGEYDFSHEVHAAMSGCLACKSCASQCPIKVDVPDFRSRFLELYHTRYLRPARDYLVGGLEHVIPTAARLPGAYNAVVGSAPGRAQLRHLGLVDSPRLSTVSLDSTLRERGIARATAESLAALPPGRRERAVVVVQDAFTSFFETPLVLDVLELLQRLGFVPLIAPFLPNGKPLHVHGFLGAFEKVAARNAAALQTLETTGVPLVGIDPSITLTYRLEYTRALGRDRAPRVQLVQEWLASQRAQLEVTGSVLPPGRVFRLLPHCTEKTAAARSVADWQAVFTALGQTLTPVAVGCCGMAGTYGHEAAHVETSRQIYALSWAEPVAAGDDGTLLASGYSCRSQVRRIDGRALPHPAQALLAVLGTGMPN